MNVSSVFVNLAFGYHTPINVMLSLSIVGVFLTCINDVIQGGIVYFAVLQIDIVSTFSISFIDER